MNQKEIKLEEEPKELKKFELNVMLNTISIGLESTIGALMVGFSAYTLGGDNFREYGEAISGGILGMGGLIVTHAYVRTAYLTDNLVKRIKKVHDYLNEVQKED